jgi:peptidoglycan/LPS O-acetylase OafA/YrhL
MGVVIMCYWWSAIWAALFLMGLFIADLNLSRQHESSELLLSVPNEKPSKAQPLNERVALSLILVVSLLILGQPNKERATAHWPWPYLEASVPSYLKDGEKDLLAEHFWLSIGAVMLVWALDAYPTLQAPLLWDFTQYLGEISFGIYVTHMLVRFTLWEKALMPWRVPLFGENFWSYLPFITIYYCTVFWAAELFSMVDTMLVRLGKRLEAKLFVW